MFASWLSEKPYHSIHSSFVQFDLAPAGTAHSLDIPRVVGRRQHVGGTDAVLVWQVVVQAIQPQDPALAAPRLVDAFIQFVNYDELSVAKFATRIGAWSTPAIVLAASVGLMSERIALMGRTRGAGYEY